VAVDDYVLAVDLGTSGPKVALVSSRGDVAASATEPVSLQLLPGGGAEQDPAEWWSAVTTASRAAVAQAGVPPEKIVAVACTAQWAGTVAADENGKPLRSAVIWMDSRGNRAIRRQVRGKVPVLGIGASKLANLVRLTGGAPSLSGKDPVAHILWLRDSEPETYKATYKFLEPVDWLNQQLTGRFAASFDSIVLHWVTDNRSINDVKYDDGLLSITGLDREKLPDLGPPASIIGTLQRSAAEQLGVPDGIPVSTGTGDLHSAAVGSGAVGDFDPHLYIGTSSWISCHVPYKKTAPTTNVASIPSAIPGRYLIADEHETAGACLTFLKDVFFADDELGKMVPEGKVFKLFDDAAENSPSGANGAMFTPWLNGERTPVDDHTIRGGFHNLSLGTSRRDMVRAVYEGVAYNSKWLLDAVERFCHRSFESLAFIGGGANSEIWCQIHADVTGRKIRQVDQPVLAGVRGAAFLAFVAMGRMKVDDIAPLVPIKRVFEPELGTRDTHQVRFAEFVKLYEQTKDIHKRLNRF
jgi:xylulokinase